MDIVFRNGELYKIEKIDGSIRRKKMSVYLIFKSILERQNPPEDLFAPNDIEGDTIPILLYSSSSPDPFSAYGNIGSFVSDSYGPFKTSFFCIEEVKNSSFACLSLLRPLDEKGRLSESILDTYQLQKTDFTIEIEFKNISVIQCASQKLVDRDLYEIEQKF